MIRLIQRDITLGGGISAPLPPPCPCMEGFSVIQKHVQPPSPPPPTPRISVYTVLNHLRYSAILMGQGKSSVFFSKSF